MTAPANEWEVTKDDEGMTKVRFITYTERPDGTESEEAVEVRFHPRLGAYLGLRLTELALDHEVEVDTAHGGEEF